MLSMMIIGNLGGDAESKVVNNQTVLTFSVAHSYSYTNQQGIKTNATTWVRCNYWLKNDNLSQYLKKGTSVYCAGMPKSHAWQRPDRSITSHLEMTVEKLQLLGGRKDSDSNVTSQERNALNNASGHDQPPGNNGDITEPMDDLPF